MSNEAFPMDDGTASMTSQLFNDTNEAWWKPAAVPSMPALVHSVSFSDGSNQGSSSKATRSQIPKKKTCRSTKARSSSSGAGAGGTIGGSSSKRKLGRPSAFPQKLFGMLTEIHASDDSRLCQDVVGFTPDGSAFQIYDNDAFVAEILPQFFKMSSFSSFQRQLQLYNFKRQSKGGPYQHALFHRDQPDRVGLMARKQSRPSTFCLSVGSS